MGDIFDREYARRIGSKCVENRSPFCELFFIKIFFLKLFSPLYPTYFQDHISNSNTTAMQLHYNSNATDMH